MIIMRCVFYYQHMFRASRRNVSRHARIQRGGGQGVWTPPPLPLKNHKNIGFLSKSSPDPLKNHKATKPAFTVGPPLARQRSANARETFLLRTPSPSPPPQKKVVNIGPPLTKLSGSAHARETFLLRTQNKCYYRQLLK